MLNPETGMDDAKYYAMVVVMAAYVDEAHGRAALVRGALERLTRAVVAEERLRARCRDLDVRAATRGSRGTAPRGSSLRALRHSPQKAGYQPL